MSENNANICNHSSAHLPKGFPVKTTQTVLFAIGGEAGNSEKNGTAQRKNRLKGNFIALRDDDD